MFVLTKLIFPIALGKLRYSFTVGFQIIFHCVKSVPIRSYSGLRFPTFGLDTERYGVSLRIQSECGKMRTKITPNTNTFYAVKYYLKAKLK